MPERQASRLPDEGSTANTTADAARRRRGLYASILTTPQGTMGAPTTTASTLG